MTETLGRDMMRLKEKGKRTNKLLNVFPEYEHNAKTKELWCSLRSADFACSSKLLRENNHKKKIMLDFFSLLSYIVGCHSFFVFSWASSVLARKPRTSRSNKLVMNSIDAASRVSRPSNRLASRLDGKNRVVRTEPTYMVQSLEAQLIYASRQIQWIS